MSRRTGRKQGFNAAKKGSGQVGFQTASPVHPEVPANMDIESPLVDDVESEESFDHLDEIYEKYKTIEPSSTSEYSLDDSVGLSLEEQVAVLEARERLASLPTEFSPDATRVANKMKRIWGLSDDQSKEAFANIENSGVKEKNYYGYLEPEEASRLVQKLIEEGPFYGKIDEGGQSLLDRISEGEILLSEADVNELEKFRDEAYNIHARDTSLDRIQPLDTEWISSAVQRKCELCGQFISTRDSHGSFSKRSAMLNSYNRFSGGVNWDPPPSSFCSGGRSGVVTDINTKMIRASSVLDAPKTISESILYSGGKRYKTRHITPISENDLLFSSDEAEWDGSLSILEVNKSKLPDYSPELLEDAYMTGGDGIRDKIIALYADKKGIGGRKTVFTIPKNIREAIVEAPPFTASVSRLYHPSSENRNIEPINKTMLVLASKIEPPFSDGEIKRMITQGDEGIVNALLSNKRTHSIAAHIVSNYPSDSVRKLALLKGRLSPEILSNMASSGSSAVRSYAASSPDLSEDDAIRLAEDPEVEVRRALIIPVSDRNEDVAAMAKTGNPERRRYIGADWTHGTYGGDSYLRRNVDKVGPILINDPDPEVAVLAFSSLRYEVNYDYEFGRSTRLKDAGITNKQKYLLSKVKSRTRFNELKKHVLSLEEAYPSTHPEVAKFLAY
jgi:hypothetical protein